MQKLTLKKIARELDVSISTVSKALKDSSEISQDTKEKIQAFAKLYNYRPNNIALSLKNQKTKTIGVILPEIVHHFFTTVISGIEKVANQRGYTVIIGLSNESFEKEVTNIGKLANGSIDGFIISVSNGTQLKNDHHHLIETINQGMPIVMFDRTIDTVLCDKVVVDDENGAKMAVNKLLSIGCKNIGIITTRDHVNVGKLRTAGYMKAHKENDIEVNESFILKLEGRSEDKNRNEFIYNSVSAFLKENEEIDGIFAVNEKYALTAVKVAQNLGRKVPEHLKVIGFTDGVLSKFASPTLTVVSQHGKELGEQAAHLLIERLESKDQERPYQTIVVATELIERETTYSYT